MASKHFANIFWKNILDISSLHCGYLVQLWKAFSVNISAMLEESLMPVIMLQQDVHFLYNNAHQATTVELAIMTKN